MINACFARNSLLETSHWSKYIHNHEKLQILVEREYIQFAIFLKSYKVWDKKTYNYCWILTLECYIYTLDKGNKKSVIRNI